MGMSGRINVVPVLLVCLAAAAGLPSAANAVGELAYDGCIADNLPGCTDLPANTLDGPVSVAVNPSGNSVYVADTTAGNVAHFFRNSEGKISYDGCVSNDGTGGFCADIPGTAGPLQAAYGVAVSPSNSTVYAVSDVGAISHFFAAAQGQISYDGCVSNDGSGGFCADVPGTGTPLSYGRGVAVSPNGASVYVTGTAPGNTVSHFFAAPQGQITYDGCVSDDGSGGLCADVPGTPLTGAFGVAVSPNTSVYVASGFSNAVSHFFAAAQGQITYGGCVSDNGSGGLCADVPGSSLDGALGVAVSPDAHSVYVASLTSTAVTHFTAAPQGQITQESCYANDTSGGCVGVPDTPLTGARSVAVSPDGRSVYVVSQTSNSISYFGRDSLGKLTFQGCLANTGADGCVDLPGNPLATAIGVAVSPDNQSVYVTGAASDSILHFFRVRAGSGPAGGGTGGPGGTKATRCGGKKATIIGTPANDKIRGTKRSDVIVGLGGKDKLSGLRGNDRICGGKGNDRVSGGAGGDRLYGDAGKDRLSGGAGKDRLSGGAGKDRLTGGGGRDRLNGGGGKDKCTGKDRKQSC